jgi:hypothetical protein
MDSRILKVLSVISGFAATVCLYFGSGMLLLAPRGPHEEFFDWRMFVFGILPTILGIMLIALSGGYRDRVLPGGLTLEELLMRWSLESYFSGLL